MYDKIDTSYDKIYLILSMSNELKFIEYELILLIEY